MRVATWNLERGGSSAESAQRQLEVLDRLGADVLVVTEPPTALLARGDVAYAPALREGRHGRESWVAVTGPNVKLIDAEIPYERLAVAASVERNDLRLLVYGSVLPWRSAPRHVPALARTGETATHMFERFLSEQEADIVTIRRAHPNTPLVWAGDFNQSLEGPNATGSRAGRTLLDACLTRLGLSAWNRSASHALDGLSAIDLICGPEDLLVEGILRIDPVQGGQHLSDHAGYVVDVGVHDR